MLSTERRRIRRLARWEIDVQKGIISTSGYKLEKWHISNLDRDDAIDELLSDNPDAMVLQRRCIGKPNYHP